MPRVLNILEEKVSVIEAFINEPRFSYKDRTNANQWFPLQVSSTSLAPGQPGQEFDVYIGYLTHPGQELDVYIGYLTSSWRMPQEEKGSTVKVESDGWFI